MRKIILYSAISIDGFIADINGGVEWLDAVPNPDQLDYGYYDFYEGIDTTIMGYSTYKQVIDWGVPFPYVGKKNYVLTRKSSPHQSEHVSFIKDNVINKIKMLKSENGKDIWLVGGGGVNAYFLKNDLIDIIHLITIPIILNEGIPLFSDPMEMLHLHLKSAKSFPNGVLETIYEIDP